MTPTASQPAVARLEERHGAVHAAAHRHGDAAGIGPRPDGRPQRVVERVERERRARDGGRLERRQARAPPRRARRRRAPRRGPRRSGRVDGDGDPGQVAAARGVPDELPVAMKVSSAPPRR